MIRSKFLLILFLMNVACSNAQLLESKLIKTKETIKLINTNLKVIKGESTLNPIGFSGNNIVYTYETYNNPKLSFYLLNEDNYSLSKAFEHYVIDPQKSYFYSFKDSLLFYRIAEYSDQNEGFSKLYLRNGKNSYYLDSISNVDKKIQTSFSTDGKVLVISTLNSILDFYNPIQDDKLTFVQIDSLQFDHTKRIYFPCRHCSDAYLIGNKLFYNKSNIPDDLTNGFEWKDLYMATWPELKDTVKIASNTKIKAVSADGNYILCIRQFDLPNNPCAILDVHKKKYQLLLGRDYAKAECFYSLKVGKFAFDFQDGRIIYVDYPDEFPFDASLGKIIGIPDWTDSKFYEQFNQNKQ